MIATTTLNSAVTCLSVLEHLLSFTQPVATSLSTIMLKTCLDRRSRFLNSEFGQLRRA
ncbi:MAG: hypothetical protein ACK55Z_23110 [bacterium]